MTRVTESDGTTPTPYIPGSNRYSTGVAIPEFRHMPSKLGQLRSHGKGSPISTAIRVGLWRGFDHISKLSDKGVNSVSAPKLFITAIGAAAVAKVSPELGIAVLGVGIAASCIESVFSLGMKGAAELGKYIVGPH